MFNLFKKNKKNKFEEKQVKKGQTTFCYCKCGNELISSKSCLMDTDFVYFQCYKCKKISKWDFDAPCPILVKDEVSIDEL